MNNPINLNSQKNKKWLWISSFLLILCTLTFFSQQHLLNRFFWKHALISNIQLQNGYAFLAETDRSDLSSHEHPSIAQIWEDGTPLTGPANSLHDDIRIFGLGRYSFWHDAVYFSASDNSDPRINGRKYELWSPTATSKIFLIILSIFTIVITGITVYITRFDIIALPRKFKFFFQPKNIKIIKWPVALLFLATISLLILGILGRIGGFPQNSLFWKTISIDTANLTKSGNFGYITQGDINCSADKGPSPCEVLENGLPLPGERNTWHENILNNGRGSSSFWYRLIIFSSSDNSDAITNGRSYEFKKPIFLFSQIQITLIGILVYGLYALLRRINQTNQQITFPTPVTFNKTASFLLWILPFVLYFLILVIPIPIYLLKDKEIIYFIIASIVLIRSMGKDDNKNRIITFTVITFMVGISLASVWSNAIPRYSAIGGLIPWSDVMGYYRDAFQISAGNGVRYSVEANRILHTAPLAALFGATNANLQISLGIIGLFWAVVIYILSREMELSFGNKSGVICALLSILFYSSFISGTLLSENSGFLLGGIGTSVLLNGARRKHFLSVMIGVLFLTLGLNARSGAYFVLPALVLWASIALSSRFSWRRFALSGGAVFVGFGINSFFNNIFAYSLNYTRYASKMLSILTWGLVTNHNPTEISMFFPGIPNKKLSGILPPLILQTIQSDPLKAVAGILKPFNNVFQDDAPLLFGFIKNLNGFSIFSTAIYTLFIIGCIVCLFQYKKPLFSLLAAALLGILASVPLVNYVGYRGLATTASFTFCIIGASLSFLNGKLLGLSNTHSEEIKKVKNNFGFNLPGYLVLFVLIGILAGPILVSALKPNELKRTVEHVLKVSRYPYLQFVIPTSG